MVPIRKPKKFKELSNKELMEAQIIEEMIRPSNPRYQYKDPQNILDHIIVIAIILGIVVLTALVIIYK